MSFRLIRSLTERGRWEGEREEARRFPPFSSSHRPPRARLYFDYCYFLWDTKREHLCEGERKFPKTPQWLTCLISCLTSYQPVFCNDTLSPTIILAHTNCRFTLYFNIFKGESLIRFIYYIDTSVLLENIPPQKFTKTTSGTRVVYFQLSHT